MTRTLRTFGLSSLLMLGTTAGVLAATTTETTVSPAPGATVQTAPANGATYSGQSAMNPAPETTSPGNKFVTGDGRVGDAAPSAGAKLGGGAGGGKQGH